MYDHISNYAQASGYTALMFGAEAGHLDVVTSLLGANAQLTLKNKVWHIVL